MLGLVPLLVPAATAAATGVVMLLLLIAVSHWFRPTQPDPGTPRFHYFTRFVKWSKGKLIAALSAAEKRLTSALSHAVAARSGAIVALMGNLNEIGNRLAGSLEQEAEQTYNALRVLRHVTLPTEIQQALRPVIQRANEAWAFGKASADTLTAVSVAFDFGLGRLPWGSPAGLPNRVAAFFNSYDHIWTQFFQVVKPQLALVTQVEIPALWNRLWATEQWVFGKLTPRVQALEIGLAGIAAWIAGLPARTQAELDRLIEPGIFALAAYTAVQRLAPNLFCRNTTTVTQRICGMDETMLQQLLAGALVFALVLDPRLIARLGQEFTGALDGVIRQTAQV
jgi:hypothetical protein